MPFNKQAHIRLFPHHGYDFGDHRQGFQLDFRLGGVKMDIQGHMPGLFKGHGHGRRGEQRNLKCGS